MCTEPKTEDRMENATVESMWLRFAEAYFGERERPESQYKTMRTCFYSGAIGVHAMFVHVSKGEDDTASAAKLDAIEEELQGFIGEIAVRRAVHEIMEAIKEVATEFQSMPEQN